MKGLPVVKEDFLRALDLEEEAMVPGQQAWGKPVTGPTQFLVRLHRADLSVHANPEESAERRREAQVARPDGPPREPSGGKDSIGDKKRSPRAHSRQPRGKP